MDETRVKMTGGGRIVIPSNFRRAMGIQEGDDLILRMENGELRLLTVKQSVEQAQQIFRQYVPKNKSLVNELIAERRNEAKYE